MEEIIDKTMEESNNEHPADFEIIHENNIDDNNDEHFVDGNVDDEVV